MSSLRAGRSLARTRRGGCLTACCWFCRPFTSFGSTSSLALQLKPFSRERLVDYVRWCFSQAIRGSRSEEIIWWLAVKFSSLSCHNWSITVIILNFLLAWIIADTGIHQVTQTYCDEHDLLNMSISAAVTENMLDFRIIVHLSKWRVVKSYLFFITGVEGRP